jgi:hypothetical protein
MKFRGFFENSATIGQILMKFRGFFENPAPIGQIFVKFRGFFEKSVQKIPALLIFRTTGHVHEADRHMYIQYNVAKFFLE